MVADALETTAAASAPAPAAVYWVVEDRLETLETRFAAFARRAKKLGVEAPRYVLGARRTEYLRRFQTQDGWHQGWSLTPGSRDATGAVRVRVEVTLVTPHRFGLAGWTFLALIDWEIGFESPTIHTALDVTIDGRFRSIGNVCEHCHLARNRKLAYVVQHTDGRCLQVGSGCIDDFLGVSAAAAIGALELSIAAVGACDEDSDELSGGSGYCPTQFSVVSFLSWVALCIREDGWLSRTEANARNAAGLAGSATADVAWSCITSRDPVMRNGREVSPTDEDVALAKTAAEWMSELSDQECEKDYFYNLRTYARADVVTSRAAGIVASAIATLRRIEERKAQAARDLTLSKHVGTVGERLWVEVEVIGEREMPETQWGSSILYKFVTTEGAILTTFASRYLHYPYALSHGEPRIELGDKIWIKGTVKKHGDYKGIQETQLSRVAVEISPDDVKAQKEAIKAEKKRLAAEKRAAKKAAPRVAETA